MNGRACFEEKSKNKKSVYSRCFLKGRLFLFLAFTSTPGAQNERAGVREEKNKNKKHCFPFIAALDRCTSTVLALERTEIAR